MNCCDHSGLPLEIYTQTDYNNTSSLILVWGLVTHINERTQAESFRGHGAEEDTCTYVARGKRKLDKTAYMKEDAMGRWHVAGRGEKKNAYKFRKGNLNKRNHLDNLGIDVSRTLKWIWKEKIGESGLD